MERIAITLASADTADLLQLLTGNDIRFERLVPQPGEVVASRGDTICVVQESLKVGGRPGLLSPSGSMVDFEQKPAAR